MWICGENKSERKEKEKLFIVLKCNRKDGINTSLTFF